MRCFWEKEHTVNSTAQVLAQGPAGEKPQSNAENQPSAASDVSMPNSMNTERDSAAPVYGNGQIPPAPPSAPSPPSTSDDDDTAQNGVKKIEATNNWSRLHIVLAYIFIWIILFTDALQQCMAGALTPYVTSAFSGHSLTAATIVMSTIIGGLAKLPLAKILDIWGRPQGLALSVVLLDLGLIMMAACQDVKTFAVAQVFYWVGFNGLTYSLQIFIADTSALEYRALAFAFSTSPFMITTFAGGPLATAFMSGPGFRWAFGVFAVVMPLVCAPLLALFAYNGRIKPPAQEPPAAVASAALSAGGNLEPKDGESSGVVVSVDAVDAVEETKPYTKLKSLRHYAIEFDLVGMLLCMTGLAMFLLPFSIYSYQALKWRSPMILSFLVLGIVFLGLFVMYERFWAPKTLMPYSLMTDRTVLGSCVTSGSIFVSFFIWDNFFTSFLQVVSGLSVTEASYVGNIYNLGTCFFSFIVGALVRCTGRFKWLALYFGVPVNIIGAGLMIHFRQPGCPLGFIVMCQVMISFAGGTMVICDQMALMASVPHQYLAVGLALENMFANIGGGIGSSVASAIWTGVFPSQLAKHLPNVSKEERARIYGDLSVQLSYERGSEIRLGIEAAYGATQRYILIAATCVMGIALFGVIFWRDLRVKDVNKAKIQVH
ncbi:hypothetical protein SEUCBS140593_002101 [Sporothrix eucalyptigena]|uniref:Siderophore iron transporter mirB n=1 Tax=Sporothrix eucalyptigena TaxID=1812306 RepID=A0ABP0B3T9_9PEZI